MLYELCIEDEVVVDVIAVTLGNSLIMSLMIFGDILGFSVFVAFGEGVGGGSFFSLIGDGGTTGVGVITAVLRCRDDLLLAFDGGR